MPCDKSMIMLKAHLTDTDIMLLDHIVYYLALACVDGRHNYVGSVRLVSRRIQDSLIHLVGVDTFSFPLLLARFLRAGMTLCKCSPFSKAYSTFAANGVSGSFSSWKVTE